MIQFLYTGAAQFEGLQPNPDLSIGGYISSSELPNGLPNNIFGGVSKHTLQQNKPEVRVIAVKNNSGGTLVNFKMYLEYPADESSSTNIALITVGFADPLTDNCGDLYVPSIGSIYAIPPDVTFNDVENKVNITPLGDLADGAYIILYLKRVFTTAALEPLSDEDLLAIFDGTLVLPKVEDTKIYFSWDD